MMNESNNTEGQSVDEKIGTEATHTAHTTVGEIVDNDPLGIGQEAQGNAEAPKSDGEKTEESPPGDGADAQDVDPTGAILESAEGEEKSEA